MPRTGVPRALVVCGLVAMTAAACGGAKNDDALPAPSATTPPTASAAPTVGATATPGAGVGYVARLIQLCAELEPKVIAAYGGAPHPAPFPIEEFVAESPRLSAVLAAFDTLADAIPVASADRSAAAAFDAYRRESDAANARLAAAAATGDQATFDAAWYEVHRMFENNPTVERLTSAGIVCNAR